MYVTKRGDKYRAWERIVDLDGSVRKISVTMDRDTPQARKKAMEQLREKMSRPFADLTYPDLVDLYIEYQKNNCKMSTWTRNDATLRRLTEVFGNARLSVMNAGFIASRLAKKTSDPGTYNEYLKRVKALFRWAYRYDYIPDSACVDKIPTRKGLTKKEKVADKFLEASELKEVLEESSEYYSLIFEFLALSGLRIGELIALDDKDVGEDILVRATYDPINKVVNTPKTASSWRYVHVQPELASCIRRIRVMSKENMLVHGVRLPYFVVSPRGGRLSYPAANNTFKGICARLTGKRLTLHALRHTHVALMAENGADIETIGRRLGHSNARVTKEIYYHCTSKQREKDAAVFDAISILK